MTSFSRNEKITVAAFMATSFLLHLITNLSGGYGFFRDELYYLACSDHLAWGYVDQPPFSLFLLKLSRLIFGDSLTAVRFFPAVSIAITIGLTALITKEMSGKLWAIFLACLCIFVSPIHIAAGGYYSMNNIDILIWALSIFIILKIMKTENPSWWLWLGVVLGVGLLNKISVLFLGAGIGTGLLLEKRGAFVTRWPYIAGCIAVAFFLPYVLWNLNNDLAHLEFIRNASGEKYAGRTRMDFLHDQILLLHPLNLLIWLSGLAALFFYLPLRPYRIVGWIFITTFLILVINRTSKGEYMAPAYSGLFAAAGVWSEQKLNSLYVRWLKFVYPALLIITAGILLPLVLPVMSPEHFVEYSNSIGIKPSSSENKKLSEMPQFYADMFGWQEKAADVAKVYNALTEDEKKKCAIFSNNYGRCGAIDFFGTAYGLPKSIGNHNNYWIWGPRDYTGEIMIILGGSLEDQQEHFESVEVKGVSTCTYCMPYENNVNIYLCRGLKASLAGKVWENEKHYE